MQTIGAFDAKTHFSQIIEQVLTGEEFTVTKHGKPVARIVPMATESTGTPVFDAEKRRKAIAAISSLRESIRAQTGTMTRKALLEMVHEGRKERDARISASSSVSAASSRSSRSSRNSKR